MSEIITESKTIYEGRILNLVVNHVQLSDGSDSLREVVQLDGAAAIVALDDENQVLLVRQFRSGIQQVTLEIPAGLLNPAETPLECAIRELREETGYQPGSIESIGGIHPAPGYTTEYVHLFYATHLEYAPLKQDDDEFITLERLPLSQALVRIENGEITDSKTIVGLMRIAHRST